MYDECKVFKSHPEKPTRCHFTLLSIFCLNVAPLEPNSWAQEGRQTGINTGRKSLVDREQVSHTKVIIKYHIRGIIEGIFYNFHETLCLYGSSTYSMLIDSIVSATLVLLNPHWISTS